MKTVVFTFQEQASEAHQDQIGHQILSVPGVQNVGRVSPTSTKSALRRMWYAEVVDDVTASHLVGKLRADDDIQSADLPAERWSV